VNNCVSIDIAKSDQYAFNTFVENNKLAMPYGLTVNTVDGLSNLCTYIYGGLTLNYNSYGNPCCTSGFSVINSSGLVKGIVTAGHATTGNLYLGSHNLPYQSGFNGASYDCQWRVCPGLAVTNKIQYWSDGSTLNVNSKKSRSEQHVGDIVSKYGLTTNYTAGQITSTNYLESSPYDVATWIEVSNIYGYDKMAEQGDSGGPWFTGNGNGDGVVALGITHSVSADRQKAYYMAENYIEALSMYVMTSP
jgi:hypothetical protein